MKINEFTNNLNTYIATVRVILRDSTSTARTSIVADGIAQAKSMLTRIYGAGNVMSIQAVKDEEVTEATKTLSPQELQIKSMTDRAKQLNQQAKQTKARQSLAKAQEKLRQISEFD